MHELEQLGREHDLEAVSRRLRTFAGRLGTAVVGAFHVTCSDGAELECADAFRRSFVNSLLPSLKSGRRVHFHAANLGGRYEWGALPVAERHFATPESADGGKLLVVKINSHVGFEETAGGPQFGRLYRYSREDSCCGALHAFVEGSARAPFIGDLEDVFLSEGVDRLEALRDGRVDPRFRSVFAAVANARLQARSAAIEAQHHRASTPTVYVIVPCVTLNQAGRDSEIVVGVYTLDYRGAAPVEEYVGLGDDPSRYTLEVDGGRLRIVDESGIQSRPARDHREVIGALWRRHRQTSGTARNPELAGLLKRVEKLRRFDHPYARTALKAALRLLVNLNPITAALLVFGEGLAEVHHAHRVHRLAHGKAGVDEAHAVLRNLDAALDTLSAEEAAGLAGALLAELGTDRRGADAASGPEDPGQAHSLAMQ